MVTAALAGFGVDVPAGSRKDPLPPEFSACVDVLAAKSEWRLDPAGACLHVAPVELAGALHSILEDLVKAGGEHRAAVATSLSLSNDDLGPAEVEIFDA